MRIRLIPSAVLSGLLTLGMLAGTLSAQAPATKTAPTTAAPAAKGKTATVAVSDADIASAKSKGMVWVNTNTKVYHKDGANYGKTKDGKFMAEADAQKAGFRAAKESSVGKKGSKKAAPATK